MRCSLRRSVLFRLPFDSWLQLYVFILLFSKQITNSLLFKIEQGRTEARNSDTSKIRKDVVLYMVWAPEVSPSAKCERGWAHPQMCLLICPINRDWGIAGYEHLASFSYTYHLTFIMQRSGVTATPRVCCKPHSLVSIYVPRERLQPPRLGGNLLPVQPSCEGNLLHRLLAHLC